MKRKFDINDIVICKESGVIGKVLEFYIPTACEEQTMVETSDRRKYHAPTSTWILYNDIIQDLVKMKDNYSIKEHNPTMSNTIYNVLNYKPIAVTSGIDFGIINPYEEYIQGFAHNHGITIEEAQRHPMCKARFEYFNTTGR